LKISYIIIVIERRKLMDQILKEARKNMLRELFKDGRLKPMKFKELCGFLSVPKDERNDFHMLLEELITERLIVCDESGRYGLSNARELVGTYTSSLRGFGFVICDDEDDDIFISEENNMSAIHGDRVRVVLTAEAINEKDKKRRAEGKIIEIIEHTVKQVVGLVQRKKNTCFVIPDNKHYKFDVFVPIEKAKNVVEGTKVVCKINNYGLNGKNPEGEIVSILGHMNDPGVDILSIIKSYDVPYEFPQEVLDDVEKRIPDHVLPEEYNGRTDLRQLPTVTIDGEDAKDLDDAITLSKEGNIYHLGVHIADVSHYVTEGSELDKEALRRGTSVYTADRVVPMLPHALSNGICSLNQGVDRLALSCLMDIDEKGKMVSHSIEETVINVDRRMNYHEVNNIINKLDESDIAKYSELVPMFELMFELSKILLKKRDERGALEFDSEECKIVLDDKNRAVDIVPYDINDANKIIEEFMLSANETVAEEYYWMNEPFLYRTHEEPDKDKLTELNSFLLNFGVSIHIGNEIHSKEIQKLLAKTQDMDAKPLISRVVLRSMKQARYTTECLGHFGLAAKYYSHFTSPIRRYPDLQIHRIIKENLAGKLDDKRIEHYNEILDGVASSCSSNERRADEVERESEKLKKAEFMYKHRGEVFEGTVSGVTNWGMYVELPNTVEGLIRYADMTDDYYSLDKYGFSCTGEKYKNSYSIGQKVSVLCVGASKFERTVDFVLADDYEVDDFSK
jgi:ribonuclease R